VVDHLPLTAEPEFPRPRLQTLALLVGRVTTIKLAYWFALTAIEAAIPLVYARPFADRFPVSVAVAVIVTAITLAWTRVAARTPDRVAGILTRSIPTVATTFAATTVVASPACLPLLILERERSLEGCGGGTCHIEAMLLWVTVLAIATVVIPAVFALSLHSNRTARSLGH
jgi:hypothetical protein